MANSNWDKKGSPGTSSSREESGGLSGSPSGSEDRGDAFETGNTRQGGMSGAGAGGRDSGQQGDGTSGSGLDDSRDRGMSGTSGTSSESGGMRGASGTTGSTGLGGETSEGSTSRPGGVEGTSTRDGREDPDRGSQR
jgi:hypothetical protein